MVRRWLKAEQKVYLLDAIKVTVIYCLDPLQAKEKKKKTRIFVFDGFLKNTTSRKLALLKLTMNELLAPAILCARFPGKREAF